MAHYGEGQSHPFFPPYSTLDPRLSITPFRLSPYKSNPIQPNPTESNHTTPSMSISSIAPLNFELEP